MSAEAKLRAGQKKQDQMRRELDYLNSRLIVRVYRKIANFFAKLRKK